jgi:hypothetical protein
VERIKNQPLYFPGVLWQTKFIALKAAKPEHKAKIAIGHKSLYLWTHLHGEPKGATACVANTVPAKDRGCADATDISRGRWPFVTLELTKYFSTKIVAAPWCSSAVS